MRKGTVTYILTMALAVVMATIIPVGSGIEAKAATKIKEVDTSTYTPSTFPYSNSSKAKSLIKVYEKALKNPNDLEYVTMEENKSKREFKQTLSETSTLYYGKMKSGRPNGEGVIFKNGKVNYMGNFKDGMISGYGIEIDANFVVYEGNFKDGLLSGDGLIYSAVSSLSDNDYYGDLKDEISEAMDNNPKYVTDFNLIPVYISEDGKYSKSSITSGKIYKLNKSTMMPYLLYDGDFKSGKYDGKGTLYYPNGKKQYEGSFSDGKYNGKGTLYNEDGSVKYKGKFKKGNIA